MYNLTNVTGANDFYALTHSINEVGGGLPVVMLLVVLFLVMFVAFKRYEEDTRKVFMSSSLLILFLSFGLWGIDLLGFNIVIYPLIAFVFSGLFYLFTE